MNLESARRDLMPAFERALADLTARWGDWPPRLAEACAYALSTGGKRVRPLLALLAAEAAGGPAAAATPFALAVELVHTYSLVHDDLPAMDDDDLRRGLPTVHKKYDEAHAILVGDALLTEAFAVLGAGELPAARVVALVTLLARAAGGGGMVGGQVLDIDAAPMTDTAALEGMHRLKTGALIRAAAEGGALAVGADAPVVEALGRYGAALGLLFQITDDLLDAGQDAGAGNRSYLDHLSVAGVEARRDLVAEQARGALAALGPRADALRALVDYVATRTS